MGARILCTNLTNKKDVAYFKTAIIFHSLYDFPSQSFDAHSISCNIVMVIGWCSVFGTALLHELIIRAARNIASQATNSG